jgi:integrase
MIDTECKDVRVKRLFLFSCFTGLRFKDIFNLRWKNLVKVEDGVYQMEIVQQKTKKPLAVPLSANAMQWLPDRYMDGEENRIFQMPETSCAYDYLHDWAGKAGIRKKVTFHVGRHTYATLLLYYGADLYTVSKLLGHTNVKTTQIYAKVMDESKRKAVNLIPQV